MTVPIDRLDRWQKGWSLARGTALPVRDGAALRVDVGWPDQVRRYVFSEIDDSLHALAASIDAPHVHIKACATPEQLFACVPQHWTLDIPRFFMAMARTMGNGAALPAGYRFEQTRVGPVTSLRILAQDGSEAASGFVIVFGRSAVFDRIATAEAHQRRGLASALMRELDRLAGPVDERLLVATEAGRLMYQTLGWEMLSPYATVISQDRG